MIDKIKKMSENFKPNRQGMIDTAWNKRTSRIPLYEHGISPFVMERVMGKPVWSVIEKGTMEEFSEAYRRWIEFYRFMGYDLVNFDQNIGGFMPGSGALLGEKDGVIGDRADFNAYPWEDVPRIFKEKTYPHFKAFLEQVPDDVSVTGGPGNGIFECVQDVVGFMKLCYIKSDDPELYADLFKKQAEINLQIWTEFLDTFGHRYDICRFGDDLGYKMNTLLSAEDIIEHVVPGYAKIGKLIHSHNKPFLYHSCGCIFDVMDSIIGTAGINAKHSNEDVIAPISKWLDLYNDRIAIFGGIDVDVVCRSDVKDLRAAITEIYMLGEKANGYAFGSGNSIADYVPTENYINMIAIFRELRGE